MTERIRQIPNTYIRRNGRMLRIDMPVEYAEASSIEWDKIRELVVKLVKRTGGVKP